MRRVSRQFLLGIAVAVVFAFIWQKVRIFISISLSPWAALAIFGVLVVGLFLMLDHFINGS